MNQIDQVWDNIFTSVEEIKKKIQIRKAKKKATLEPRYRSEHVLHILDSEQHKP